MLASGAHALELERDLVVVGGDPASDIADSRTSS